MRLVFVHGRDQQGKSSQELHDIWMSALTEGLSSAGLNAIDRHEVVVPFYGDTLVDLVEQMRRSANDSFTTKGPGSMAPSKVEAFQLQLLQELVQIHEIPLEAPLGPAEKGLQNTRVAHLMARIADTSRWGPDVLRLATEDVSIYLNSASATRQVNAIVDATIPKSEPCVVVGHSLGSVVAYRVLRERQMDANVVRFITLGSPLGLQTIRDALRPLQVPAGVRSWLNVYDSRDIVALRPLDSSTWNVEPPIKNLARDMNHMSNRHGISGYLDYPEVATAIFEALNSE